MRRTRNPGGSDARMLLQHFLDLGGRDIDSGALDHLAVARHELQISVCVQPAEIAGAEEAVGREGLGVLLAARAVVAGRQPPFHFDEAHLALRERLPALGIDDADRDPRKRRALNLHAALERPVVPGHAAVAVRLGLAVHVADLACTEHFSDRRHVLGGADGHGAAEAASALGPERGMRDHRRGHGRHRVDQVAGMAFDDIERLRRLESALQHERGAVSEARTHRVCRAVRPEER